MSKETNYVAKRDLLDIGIPAQHTMPMDRMYAESDIITATLRGSTSVGCDDV